MSKDEYTTDNQRLNLSYRQNFTFKANNYYLGITSYKSKEIYFYNLKNRNANLNEYFILVLNFSPMFYFYFELNQKFVKILLVINPTNNNVELYELPEIFNGSNIELIPKFIYQEHSSFIHTALFNPKYSHIIATFSYDCFLHI